MSWKKGLGLFIVLAALTGTLWLSRSSLDPARVPSSDRSNVSAPPERTVESGPAPPQRPWEGIKPRPIAGPPVFPPKPAPQDLQVEWQGSWYAAEILSASGSSNLIRYKGYGPEWDEWVTAERMRFLPPDTIPPERGFADGSASKSSDTIQQVRLQPAAGDLVVKWGNQWWRAEVLQTEGDKSRIRYVGYDARHDEWVTPDRVKTFSAEDERPPDPPAVATQPEGFFVHGSPGKGDLLVQWGSGWWPAEVLESQGTQHFIRYKGYGPEWDEWVTPQRLGVYEGD
jgi:Agenet domain